MNATSRVCLAAAVVAVAALGLASTASAQDVNVPQAPEGAAPLEKTTTVTDRPRPELDPLGIRMGAFKLFPTLGVSVTHDDNIFRTNTGEVDDIITVVNPGFRLSSDWNRHSLDASANGKFGRYADRNAEDYEDYDASLGGRVDITRRANVTAGAIYSKLHEDRSSPDNAGGINPTEYALAKVNVTFNQTFNRVKLAIGAILSQYDYDDVATSTGSVNNDDRDRDETEGFVRFGYEITPSYEAFVRAAVNDRSYDARTDDNGQQRDSNGYQIDTGVRLDLGGVTFGDVFVGYLKQTYDQPTFQDTTGINYGASLTWNATQLTTAKFSLSRTVGETTSSGTSGVLTTSATASVDHELRRNVLIGGKLGYSKSDFRGSTREDETTSAGIYGKYMLSRYFHFTAGYDYSMRESITSSNEYTNNQFMIRLVGQL